MSEVRIPAEPRTEFGKGGARRTRRAGKVPAVLYGHGQEPRHLSLPIREITNALRHDANALLELQLDGGAELALAKDVQRDPLKQSIDHIDLIAVRRGEKVQVEVAINLVGESPADTLVQLESSTVTGPSLSGTTRCTETNLPTGQHATKLDPAGTSFNAMPNVENALRISSSAIGFVLPRTNASFFK